MNNATTPTSTKYLMVDEDIKWQRLDVQHCSLNTVKTYTQH